MYNSGARKVALFGAGSIGNLPFEVATCGTKGGTLCVDKLNNAAQLFNARLKSLVTYLNTNLFNAKFTYIDTYGIGLSGVASSPPGNINHFLFIFIFLYILSFLFCFLDKFKSV